VLGHDPFELDEPLRRVWVLLVNNGTSSSDTLSSIVLSTTASPSSLLDTEATNGLQMVIEKCSTPWTEAGTAPAYTYTCSGTTSTVLASRAVAQRGLLALALTLFLTLGVLPRLGLYRPETSIRPRVQRRRGLRILSIEPEA
jgi:hypothetical protein